MKQQNFLKKIIEGYGVSPSKVCLLSFKENFADAANVEWFSKKDYYEAIFYQHNLEHIAVFDLKGILLEYRQNIAVEYLPEPIKNVALSKGEIMNSVLKNKGDMLEYELIVRDSSLTRYLILISDVGEVKEEKVL